MLIQLHQCWKRVKHFSKPAGIVRFKLLKICCSNLEGYANATSTSSKLPLTFLKTDPVVSSESMSGTLSIILNIRCAAICASAKYFRFGRDIPKDLQHKQIIHKTTTMSCLSIKLKATTLVPKLSQNHRWISTDKQQHIKSCAQQHQQCGFQPLKFQIFFTKSYL